MNPWHDVKTGVESPTIVNSIIEIPMGGTAKYEMDKETGFLKLDRVLYSAFYYPANYGFIPQSYGDDNDPLDILVLSQISVVPLCIIEAKVIGVMRMLDSGEGDDKIIAVAAKDMSVNYINEITDLPKHFFLELRQFFEQYKRLENKTVVVEDFQSRQEAYKIIERSLDLYKQKFHK